MERVATEPTRPDDLAGLVRDHQAMIWRYLRLLGADPEEADDMMQETFLRVARHGGDPRRLHTPARFLRTVARNILLNSRDAAARQGPTVPWCEAVEHLIAMDPTQLSDLRIEALRHCRAQLKGRARIAVDLHHSQGLDYERVGERLGLRINGVRALLHRSRTQLRECMRRFLDGKERT